MTELKSDSQSIRTVQAQPSTRKRAPKATLAGSGEQPGAPDAGIPKNSESAEITKPKRRTTKATSGTKRQATSKSTKQVSATTQVKLSWEPSQSSIAARFAQLEAELQHLKNQATHINEQSAAILFEMDELRSISQKVQSPDRALKLPLELPQPVEPVAQIPQSIAKEAVPAIADTTRSSPPQSAQIPNRPALPRETQQLATQLRSTHSRRSGIPLERRRRSPIHRLLKQCLKLPDQPNAVAIDAALWVLASAGLRIALNLLVNAVPILAIPINLLIFAPALIAAYSALFVPTVDRIAVYRLLLVTLGLFVGGRL